MSMVELASQDEFAKLTESLHESVEETLESVSGDWSENELHSIRNRLLQMTDNVLHKLRLGVDCSGLGDHIVNKNGELVLYSGETYNKLHQEEIEELEQKANALAKDLEQRRSDVPKGILARLQAELEAVRPRSEVECSAKDAENECAGGGGIGKRPRPAAEEVEELRGKLAATGGRMPEIRARIEEAVARTDRVVRAMEYQAQASEGGSGGLGAVLRGGSEGVEGRDQEDDQDGEVSPEVRAAEAAGHISVRKKWAKLMTFSTPIKFSLKDAR